MYATLEEFLAMTPEQQSVVTFLDILIATPEDRERVYRVSRIDDDDPEEYPGEAKDRGLIPSKL